MSTCTTKTLTFLPLLLLSGAYYGIKSKHPDQNAPASVLFLFLGCKIITNCHILKATNKSRFAGKLPSSGNIQCKCKHISLGQTKKFQCSINNATQGCTRRLIRNPDRWTIVPSRGFRPKRSQLAVEDSAGNGQPFTGHVKPILFTVTACGCSFIGAMIWQYEDFRRIAVNRMKFQQSNQVPIDFSKNFGFRQHINSMWNSFSKVEKFAASVMGINTIVFLLWKIRSASVQRMMIRYFLNAPTRDHATSSMLWSVFSHQSALHLFVNMYVFWSFAGSGLQHIMEGEELGAVYLSGGVMASLMGSSVKMMKGVMNPSLGASGAVLTMISMACLANPDARLTIAFIGDITGLNFSAKSGLIGIVCFDTLGLLLGWKFMDHAAHLGGTLFGIWYYKYGKNMIWNRREKVMSAWHKLRGPPTNK